MSRFSNLIQAANQDRDYRLEGFNRINDASEFDRLLRQSGIKRFIYGLEHLHEFRNYTNIDENNVSNKRLIFYCDLCHLELDYKDFECVAHCADYLHLFKYAKAKYPIEYSRLLGSCHDLDSAIGAINLLLKTLNARLLNKGVLQIHTYEMLSDLLDEYNYFTEQHSDSIDLELAEYGLNLRSLMLKNKTDHDLDIQNNHDTILASIKRSPQQNSFLETLCNDDFIVVDNPINFNRNDKRVKESESQESLNNISRKRPCLNNRNERVSSDYYSDHRNNIQEGMELSMHQDEENSVLKALIKKANEIANDISEIDEDFLKDLNENYKKISLEDEVFRKIFKKAKIYDEQKKARGKQNCD